MEFQADLTTPDPWDWGRLQHLARLAYSPAHWKNMQRFPQLRSGGLFVPMSVSKSSDFWKFSGRNKTTWYVRSVMGFEKDTEERTGLEDLWNRTRKSFESLTGLSWFQIRVWRHFYPLLGARSLVVTHVLRGKWKMDRYGYYLGSWATVLGGFVMFLKTLFIVP